MKNLKVFWQLIRINFKKTLIYREQFWITLTALFLWVFVYIAFFEVLFLHVDSVAGWNKSQMLTVLAFYYFGMAIGNMFYRNNFEEFGQKVIQGKLDHVLTKPANARTLIFFENMRFDHIIDMFYAALIFVYAFSSGNIEFQAPMLVLGLSTALFGQLLFYGMLLAVATLTFFVDRIDSMGSFIWHLAQISRYPRQIFVGAGRILFQFVFPLALIGSIPAEIVLGKSSWQVLLGFTITSVIVWAIGTSIFDLGLKKYHSAN